MKAIQITETGGPEVLRLTEVDTPRPRNGEVLIRVETVGVNFIDIYQRSGVYAVPMPFVPGGEGAGTVVEIGDGVAELSVGSRVAWAGVPHSYAEFVVAQETSVVAIPDSLSTEMAAAAMLQGMTAHYLVNSTYSVVENEVVVVHAAAGGVGSLLVQLAAQKGATVIATTSTAQKAEIATHLGAQVSTDYSQFDSKARAIGGAHVVYDGVGQATFEASLKSLRPRGLLALYGSSSGQVPPFDLQRLNPLGSLFVTRPTLADYISTREQLLWRSGEILNAIANSTLSLVIARQYPLADAGNAQADLQSRTTTGKLVLTVPNS